mgnify:FL=1
MEKLYQYLPEELVTFILVTVFSLLIGLSLRRISLKREGETTLFGTDRTFTFIGILAISSIFSTRRTIACLWVAGLFWGCCLP